ncbi:MAG: macro domain-containing protein [Deltaproteobacteria bacterium]|nr:macro domain-containing protein [Deltaproteobacteria bacterium]
MIELVRGNILEAKTEALVNPVNTQGVMGKGLALQFKRAFPSSFEVYRREAKAGRLRTGMVLVDEAPKEGGPRWIVHFPTKAQWRRRLDRARGGSQPRLSPCRRRASRRESRVDRDSPGSRAKMGSWRARLGSASSTMGRAALGTASSPRPCAHGPVGCCEGAAPCVAIRRRDRSARAMEDVARSPRTMGGPIRSRAHDRPLIARVERATPLRVAGLRMDAFHTPRLIL